MEQYFEHNRQQLAQIELPRDHRSRMESRLSDAKAKTHPRRSAVWLSIGAFSAAAVVAIALWVVVPVFSDQPPTESLTAEQIEVREAEQFYLMRRNAAVESLKALLVNVDLQTQQQITKDIELMIAEFDIYRLPITLFKTDPAKYAALTVERYEIQYQTIENLSEILTSKKIVL